MDSLGKAISALSFSEVGLDDQHGIDYIVEEVSGTLSTISVLHYEMVDRIQARLVVPLQNISRDELSSEDLKSKKNNFTQSEEKYASFLKKGNLNMGKQKKKEKEFREVRNNLNKSRQGYILI